MADSREPTQRGDEIAAKMRAYYEDHKRTRYIEGNADSLMIGLMNIVLNSIHKTE